MNVSRVKTCIEVSAGRRSELAMLAHTQLLVHRLPLAWSRFRGCFRLVWSAATALVLSCLASSCGIHVGVGTSDGFEKCADPAYCQVSPEAGVSKCNTELAVRLAKAIVRREQIENRRVFLVASLKSNECEKRAVDAEICGLSTMLKHCRVKCAPVLCHKPKR
jgi:hypothetical protein